MFNRAEKQSINYTEMDNDAILNQAIGYENK